MDEPINPVFDAELTAFTLEQEFRLIRQAVAAVASGAFPRVTVAGLRFGDELLPRARSLARARGLFVRPLFFADEHGADIVVEREQAPETPA